MHSGNSAENTPEDKSAEKKKLRKIFARREGQLHIMPKRRKAT